MDPVDSDDRLRSQQAQVQRAAAAVADTTARHAFAQQQARRYEQLFAEKATSEELLAARRQDLQLASAALAAAREDQARAQSDLQALRTQRASLRLVSPVDGLVTARDAEPGTTLVAGQMVVEVVDPTSLWVNTRFDQVSAAGLAAQQGAGRRFFRQGVAVAPDPAAELDAGPSGLVQGQRGAVRAGDDVGDGQHGNSTLLF